MERKYDPALLEAMKRNQYETDSEGVKVLVKPIPEGGEPGDMDPRVYRSMRMMPVMSKLMRLQKKPKSPLDSVLSYRKMFNEYKGIQLVESGVRTHRVSVTGDDGYAVPVRVYTPEAQGEGRSVFVYYHGGGFFGGGPDIVEQMCKVLVKNTGCVAFSVDYRLCPENHYPQPLDDCWCATKWAYENAKSYGGDREKLMVSGDSAGGNLAAVITLRDRDEGTGMVKAQALIYPAVNIAGKETEFYHGVDPSQYQHSKRHAKVINAVAGMMSSMMGPDGNMLDDVYLQGNLNPEHIYASPLLDDQHGLPPTLLLFGEHDFLAFEDFAYARTLIKAGVPLKTVIYRGMGHGFADQIGVAPQAEDCMDEIADFMAAVFSPCAEVTR